MAETEASATFNTGPADLTRGDATIVSTIAEQLDSDLGTLDIYEGELTGSLYAETDTGYQRGVVTETGLQVTQVTTPDEALTPLARIEPDEGETVEDAVDNLTFAGD